ncbi:MAG: hypothetical protein IJ789_06480 [Bacteroidales bacterium]|nr:hypothetical protein [Bacteroidales bacterium]
MVALRWSLIPGAGQIYNHQAWKIPIIYTAFAVTGYVAYRHYNSMVTFRDEYLYRINNGVPNLQAYANYGTSNIYNLYQSYSRYFQLSIIVGVGFYALNLLDAYVFGHLFDFQLDESLALRASPTLLPCGDVASPALSLNLTF